MQLLQHSAFIILVLLFAVTAFSEIPEPEIGLLMPKPLTDEFHGNYGVWYDTNHDGVADIGFLHRPAGPPKKYVGCKSNSREGAYLYIWAGCGDGGTPIVYRLLRKHLAVNGSLVGSKIWLWYIKGTWPPK